MSNSQKAAPIPALLPCPFCGVDGSIEEGFPGHFMAICMSCYCNVGESVEPTTGAAKHMFESADEAAEAWNRRADREARPSLPNSREERIREDERLRFESDLDRWMKTLGAGITGYQPEAYAVMDAACAELVLARARIAAIEALVPEGERMRTALHGIAHTFTEDSHGGMKTMSASYYQEIARAALIPEAPVREAE